MDYFQVNYIKNNERNKNNKWKNKGFKNIQTFYIFKIILINDIDTEVGMCSIYEFIYSFRNSLNALFPNAKSKEAEHALTMMKKIKNEISLGLCKNFLIYLYI